MSKVLIAINQARVLYDFKRELVDALLERGDEVFLSFEEDFRADEFRKGRAVIIPTPIDPRGVNPLRDLKLYRFYRSTLRQLRPDLVLTFTIKPNVYCGYACGRAKIPYFSTLSGLGAAMNAGGALQLVSTALYRAGLKRAEKVFCQNESIAQRVVREKMARAEQIVRVSGSGVNLERFSYKAYPEEKEGPVFLFVGRLMPDKGVSEYLAAARRISSEYPDVRFQILGASERGCDSDREVETAVREGVVEYLGYQLDARPYLSASSAVVLPSYHEGLSNALLEAAATGRPILASSIPGCAEIFDEGATGLGFEPRNVDALVDALRRFLTLSRARRAKMGRLGREKVATYFSRDDVVKEYLRVIDEFSPRQ